MVERCQPSRRAISAHDRPAAQPVAISSRSAKDKNRPDGAGRGRGRTPPACCTHTSPVPRDRPATLAACRVDRPSAHDCQNISTRAGSTLAWPRYAIATPFTAQVLQRPHDHGAPMVPGCGGVRSSPRAGSRRKHTDSQSVLPPPPARSSSTRLSGKPLVIEARVPLVMERRKPVNQP